MAKVKLLGASMSPFSCRVEWALKIKGVQYEFIEEDLQNKSPLLLESNPIHKKIPVLIHKGKPICESMIIVEYIDEIFEGPSILPKHPYDRAIARFWANFFDQKCLPEMIKLCYDSSSEVRVKARGELHELLKLLENELMKNNMNIFEGDTVGYIDIASIPITYWLGVIQEALEVDILKKEEFPNICVWADKLMSCSFVKENLPPREKLLAFYKLMSNH